MTRNKNLHYRKHQQIDSEKWDRCIGNAPNSRVYANTWHLDRTAEIWDALIWGDYECVMPLPYRKKFGIKYLYQPLYSQQLGIFPDPTPEISRAFYEFIVANFRYSDVQTNAENSAIKEIAAIRYVPRNNYLLSLAAEYSSISSSFSKNTKRNITKANKNKLSLAEGIRLEEYLKFKSENLMADIGTKELAQLKSLISYGQYKGFGQIYGVYDNDNQLCAAVYFCRWKDRIIYFNAASSAKGKELGAMYFLVNRFIESNAGKLLVLDFEGSMIPGVARFYEGFGAQAEIYFQLKFNRLPLPFRWFKR